MSTQGWLFRGIVVSVGAAGMLAVGPMAANAVRLSEGGGAADAEAVRTAVSAGMADTCQVHPLPVPAGTESSSVVGGDHTGRYLVGQASVFNGAAYTLKSLLWTEGRLRTLDTRALAPYVQVSVTDVNSFGAFVGYRMTDVSTFHTDAWVRRDGVYTLLPALEAGDATKAVAINSAGDIIGTMSYSGSPPAVHAVIWPAAQPGTIRELMVNGVSPPWATGVDIDDDGTALVMLGQPTAPTSDPTLAHPWLGLGADRAGGRRLPSAVALHRGWVAGTAMRDEGGGLGTSAVVRWSLRDRTATLASTEYGLGLRR